MKRRILASLAVLVAAGCAATAPQTSSAYRFEAVDTRVLPSRNAELRVRIIRIADNTPVTGATIIEHRFDMLMQGYRFGTTTMVEGSNAPPILAVEEPNGIYRVHAQLPMIGLWHARLVALVPGQTEPVNGTISVAVGR